MAIKTPIFSFLICALLLFSNANASDVNFSASADGFSINLPPGWIQVPHDKIEETAENVASKVPKVEPLHPSYAFQYGHIGNWFAYPYILITVRRVGRPAEAALEKAAVASFNDTGGHTQEMFAQIMSEISVGQPVFDHKTKILWLYTNAKITEEGNISGVLAMIPTQYGVVQIQGYAAESDFMSFMPIFSRIVDSFAPDPHTKY